MFFCGSLCRIIQAASRFPSYEKLSLGLASLPIDISQHNSLPNPSHTPPCSLAENFPFPLYCFSSCSLDCGVRDPCYTTEFAACKVPTCRDSWLFIRSSFKLATGRCFNRPFSFLSLNWGQSGQTPNPKTYFTFLSMSPRSIINNQPLGTVSLTSLSRSKSMAIGQPN